MLNWPLCYVPYLSYVLIPWALLLWLSWLSGGGSVTAKLSSVSLAWLYAWPALLIMLFIGYIALAVVAFIQHEVALAELFVCTGVIVALTVVVIKGSIANF